ncbi:MAG: archease [Candidatus Paceibacterota bacterium]
MYRFQRLPHPADIRIKIEADSLEELFKGALKVLEEILEPDNYQKKKNLIFEEEINLTSYDLTSLLIDFLNQVLALSEIKKAIFSEIIFKKLSENEFSGIIKGYPVKKFSTGIKAVTYYQAEIIKNNNLYQTIIVFDI